jgi:hypothetical protein
MAAASMRVVAPIFLRMFDTWTFAVFSETKSSSPRSAVRSVWARRG